MTPFASSHFHWGAAGVRAEGASRRHDHSQPWISIRLLIFPPGHPIPNWNPASVRLMASPKHKSRVWHSWDWKGAWEIGNSCNEKGEEEEDQPLTPSFPSPPASNLLHFPGESLELLSVLAQEGLSVLRDRAASWDGGTHGCSALAWLGQTLVGLSQAFGTFGCYWRGWALGEKSWAWDWLQDPAWVLPASLRHWAPALQAPKYPQGEATSVALLRWFLLFSLCPNRMVSTGGICQLDLQFR